MLIRSKLYPMAFIRQLERRASISVTSVPAAATPRAMSTSKSYARAAQGSQPSSSSTSLASNRKIAVSPSPAVVTVVPGAANGDATVQASTSAVISAAIGASPATKMHRAFISGHIDLTPELFMLHYAPLIEVALADGHHFIIGDARGADTMALDFILRRGGSAVASRIAVYPSRAHNIERLRTLGVQIVQHEQKSRAAQREAGRDAARAHHLARDARMTGASDYDILWVRSDEECKVLYGAKWRPRISGTELNRQRRLQLAAAAQAQEKITGA
ncbi:hypothetical protein BKA62DRAFT_687956 [Auriculariales sp. MPI-PUGE-AT-0066]|nr:hypothetical protein BKA62DRAFT_687956 [Auriculariales sp. MPI-PUGE-AT-0066]